MPPDLKSRRDRLAKALPLGDAILVVGSGQPIPLPENSDQTYPFFSHAEYTYLTDDDCIDDGGATGGSHRGATAANTQHKTIRMNRSRSP